MLAKRFDADIRKKLMKFLAALSSLSLLRSGQAENKTLKMTPAMAAGVSKALCSMEDLCEKMDAIAPKLGSRGLYKEGSLTGTSSFCLS
ncbi:hypothetical protein [Mesorhizobium sp. WSM4313]|uniref:hypothetical protein n=1 Tax=Mesorhizobium sp. WSM4313 TaxID=2029412 RepID=UPI000BAF6B98|nr:hypothetical protein [Mesorhizobium sp. WSM4313]PBB16522.1 hypothetical protein CK219_28510 [Mesorhizobium sp. WSM4313]